MAFTWPAVSARAAVVDLAPYRGVRDQAAEVRLNGTPVGRFRLNDQRARYAVRAARRGSACGRQPPPVRLPVGGLARRRGSREPRPSPARRGVLQPGGGRGGRRRSPGPARPRRPASLFRDGGRGRSPPRPARPRRDPLRLRSCRAAPSCASRPISIPPRARPTRRPPSACSSRRRAGVPRRAVEPGDRSARSARQRGGADAARCRGRHRAPRPGGRGRARRALRLGHAGRTARVVGRSGPGAPEPAPLSPRRRMPAATPCGRPPPGSTSCSSSSTPRGRSSSAPTDTRGRPRPRSTASPPRGSSSSAPSRPPSTRSPRCPRSGRPSTPTATTARSASRRAFRGTGSRWPSCSPPRASRPAASWPTRWRAERAASSADSRTSTRSGRRLGSSGERASQGGARLDRRAPGPALLRLRCTSASRTSPTTRKRPSTRASGRSPRSPRRRAATWTWITAANQGRRPVSAAGARRPRAPLRREPRVRRPGGGGAAAALEADGLWDKTVVIVAADHGEELFEQGWIGHNVHLYEESVHVPLIVRVPGGPQGQTDPTSLVDLLDIAPTIADVFGVLGQRRLRPAPSRDAACWPWSAGAPGEGRGALPHRLGPPPLRACATRATSTSTTRAAARRGSSTSTPIPARSGTGSEPSPCAPPTTGSPCTAGPSPWASAVRGRAGGQAHARAVREPARAGLHHAGVPAMKLLSKAGVVVLYLLPVLPAAGADEAPAARPSPPPPDATTSGRCSTASRSSTPTAGWRTAGAPRRGPGSTPRTVTRTPFSTAVRIGARSGSA